MPLAVAPVLAPGSLAAYEQPVLHSGDLVLRPWAPGDAPAVAAAYDDPTIQHWHARSMTVTEAVNWIEAAAAQWGRETGAHWAVTDGASLLGRMSLRSIDLTDGSAEVTYWVLPAARGRAVAPRALTTVSRWALEKAGLHRLELEHSTSNQPSCAVARKAGFVLEGTRRRSTLHADGWHDMHLHAVLADEPR